MNSAILLYALIGAAPSANIEWRVPLTPEAARPRVVGNATTFAYYDSKSGGVMWNSLEGNMWRIFRFDPRQRRVLPMGEGSFDEPQIDCELGLATVHRYNPKTKKSLGETYDLATGKNLSTVMGRPTRVGRLVMTTDSKPDRKIYTDAVTGEALWQEARWGQGNEALRAPVGVPIWATPQRWLFIIGEDGIPLNDRKGVVDIGIRTLKELKRVPLSDYAMAFDGIVGNPESGPFAVFESTSRSRHCSGVFRSDMTRIPGKFHFVTDISKNGILDREATAREFRDPEFTGIVCADVQTGKVRWRASTKEPGKWVGAHVLAGDRLLDGKTGRTLGQLKLPTLLGISHDGKFVGIEGRMLVGGQIRAR
jgi:hypothetical protein